MERSLKRERMGGAMVKKDGGSTGKSEPHSGAGWQGRLPAVGNGRQPEL